MTIPYWLKPFIQSSDLKKIEAAVALAEEKTTGELVPIVVRRSSTIGHVPAILILIFSLIVFATDLIYWPTIFIATPLWASVLINIFLILAFTRILSPISMVERLLTSKEDQLQQVQQRAINEFYQHQVQNTHASTGILIFVSLMEHQVVILGDEAINAKLPQGTWEEMVNRLVQGIKDKDLASGFIDAIEMSGDLLEKNFPANKDNKNELHNHLIIRE